MNLSSTTPLCIIDSQCELGEAPVWSVGSQILYWLDISLSSTLFEWSLYTGRTRRRPLYELATGLALTDLDELIVVSETGINLFGPGHEYLRRLAEPPFPMLDMRFNDCGCDRLGRLWTGTMVNDLRPGVSHGSRVGELFRFDPDLSCHSMDSGIGCPNTFVWTPDNRTLLTADSVAKCIYAYNFDLPSGRISERRIFADPAGFGIPDGSAIDAQGFLWNARWGAGCIARFAPNGNLQEVIEIPADFVTSCAFGGPQLETLFVTTARQGLTGGDLERQPYAGGVFAFKPKVPGTVASTFRRAWAIQS